MLFFKTIKRIHLIGFFFFSFLHISFASDNITLLQQEATAENFEKARANALSLLAQNFLVLVKSDFQSSVSVDNKKVDSKSKNTINLSTIALFKGVKFINEKKIKKNIFSTTVVFDLDSFNQTKESLYNDIMDNKNVNMSKYQISLQKEKLLFLLAILDFAKTKNISVNENEYQELLLYSKKLAMESSNMAKLKFNINGALNIEDVFIQISDQKYKHMETAYLNQGKYTYLIDNPMYLKIQKTIEVRNDEQKQIDIFLEKNLNKKLPVNIIVENLCSDITKDIVFNELKNSLDKHQLSFDVKANKSLKISLSGCSENKINDKFSTYQMIIKYSIMDRFETKYVVAKEIKKVIESRFKNVGIFDNTDVTESMDFMLSQLLSGSNINLISE